MRLAKVCMALAAPIAVMSAASGAEAATIINFNNIGSTEMPVFFESVSQDGFLLTNSVPLPDTFFTWVQNSGFNADHGGYTALSNYNGSYIISEPDGAAFDFVSVDLADGADNQTGGLARSVDFTFTNGLGTTSAVAALDALRGLQTFTFNRTGVTCVTWRGSFIQAEQHNPQCRYACP